MLLSMTGHGHGLFSNDGLSLSVEIRTVNSRYAKVNVRCGEVYQSLEPQIEELVRKTVRRGTVQVNVRIERNLSGSIHVNDDVLKQYLDAIRRVNPDRTDYAIENMLSLPGVIEESVDRLQMIEADWPHIQTTIGQALESLTVMRTAEGQSMEIDLLQNCDALQSALQEVELLAPLVIENYQNRLLEKLNLLVADVTSEMKSSDILKEIGIFADKCDISEEVVRLKTHIVLFRETVGHTPSQGRKLDFLTQEMFRETNTIGSKANDARIAQHVVEMKTVIERIREMVQNIE